MNLVIDHHVPRNIFSAAPVGTVAETSYDVRLKQSCPELEPRYSKTFNMKSISKRTSPVGTLARVVTKKTKPTSCVGWYKQDLIPVDISQIETMGPMYRYSWNNQTAQLQKAKVTGDYFLPVPGGYDKSQANGILRGNAYPQPINLSSTVPSVVTNATQTSTTPPDSTTKNTTGLFSPTPPSQLPPVGAAPSGPGDGFLNAARNGNDNALINPMVQAGSVNAGNTTAYPITDYTVEEVPDIVTNRNRLAIMSNDQSYIQPGVWTPPEPLKINTSNLYPKIEDFASTDVGSKDIVKDELSPITPATEDYANAFTRRNKFKALFGDKSTKGLSIDEQKQMMEEYLGQENRQAKVDRFKAQKELAAETKRKSKGKGKLII